MTLTIQQIEEQMLVLQKTLEELKNPKLQVSRYFTGEYFNPYEGMQYRRMESEGVPVWECFLPTKKEWVHLNKQEGAKFEKIYSKNCAFTEEATE